MTTEPNRIARMSLRDRVMDRIGTDILEGRLRPGEPLRLRDTADELGVSMTPLREGLIALEHDGLVRSEPGRGFVVASLDPVEVEELYPLIALLEADALRNALPDEGQLSELGELNTRMELAADPRSRIELDRRWHETLLSRCSNGIQLELLDHLRRRARRYELAYMARQGAPAVSVGQHGRIIDALSSGRVDVSVRELEANWHIGPTTLIPWLLAGGDE